MANKKQTPSSEVDQKKIVNEKVSKARANDFNDQHVRRVTLNGADGQ